MLTIKHIESSGCEGVIEGRSVWLEKIDWLDPWERKPPMLHVYGVDREDGEDNHVTYGDGMVYVMNASGSTIASYDLDAMRRGIQEARVGPDAPELGEEERLPSRHEQIHK